MTVLREILYCILNSSQLVVLYSALHAAFNVMLLLPLYKTINSLCKWVVEMSSSDTNVLYGDNMLSNVNKYLHHCLKV